MAFLRHKLTIASLATCLTACTPLDLLNVASGSGHYRTEENVAYGSNHRQTLDIYAPSEPNPAGCRIVFVYGGSWREGDKRDYGFVGAAFARRGHEVVIPDYRVYPDVAFPAFVEDIALSVSWYQRRSDERPLVLMGHSAGALISALVSFNSKYLNAQGGQQKEIAALVTLAGPHDYFLPTDNPKWTVIFGEDPQQQISALPVNHVSADAPPTLILHGENDKIVTPRSAKSLASELERYGVFHQVRTYPDIGHRRLAASIASPLQFLAPTMSDIVAFLDAHVCKSASS